MTIQELLERVVPASDKYDPEFAAEFNSLVTTALNDRKRVNAAPYKRKAAEKFLESWQQLLDLFADDPRSLAALTLPKIRVKDTKCARELRDVFPKALVTTPTTRLNLYFAQASEKKKKTKLKTSSPRSKPASNR